MWFYESIFGCRVDQQLLSPDTTTSNVEKADSYGHTSGDEDSSACSSAAPQGIEVDHLLDCSSEYDGSIHVPVVMDSTPNVSWKRFLAKEEERGAIEVEAAGRGFVSSNPEEIKDYVGILNASATEDENELKKKSRFSKRSTLIAVILLLAGICLVAILASQVRKHSSNTTTSSSSSALEQSETASSDGEISPTSAPTSAIPSSTTQMPSTVGPTLTPTAFETFVETVVVTSDGTVAADVSCGSDDSILVTSECQSDGDESWSATTISYCFSSSRDGDWYWIRDRSEDYDQWSYTEGASEGIAELSGIPAGNYLVSLVRDSMRPYDIITTQEVTVPDCSTTTA
jgi:hypothetical protein